MLKKKYSNSCDVRKKNSETKQKTITPLFKLNGQSLTDKYHHIMLYLNTHGNSHGWESASFLLVIGTNYIVNNNDKNKFFINIEGYTVSY